MQNISRNATDDAKNSSIGETNKMPGVHKTMLDDDLDLNFVTEIIEMPKKRGTNLDDDTIKIYKFKTY